MARDCLGQEMPQKPFPKMRGTFLATLLGPQVSKGLPLLDRRQVAQGTEALPRRAAHLLLSYEGAFWVCITAFEGFSQVPAAPVSAFSRFSRLCQWARTGVGTRETTGGVRTTSHPARRT